MIRIHAFLFCLMLGTVGKAQPDISTSKPVNPERAASMFIGNTGLTDESTLIHVEQGAVRGMLGSNVLIFKGIPFAAPPVGPLRWRAPEPPSAWDGERDCTVFSASPMQANPQPFACWSEEFIAPPEPLSEDCLYLNVWTSALLPSKPQPVVVYIYGGAFLSGSSACAVYDGEALAAQGVVFVSINYRVGAFGFLAGPDLDAEAGQTSTNFGILDQIEALKWVQRNIAAFGGDPNNVTIMGQSAGSYSVHALVASSKAKGLFHKAIAHSGGILTKHGFRLNTPEKARENQAKLMELTGAKSWAELRALPAEMIQSAAEKMPFGSFVPVTDRVVLPDDVFSYFGGGLQNQIPVLTGWTLNDVATVQPKDLNVARYQQQVLERYGAQSADFLKVFPGDTDEKACTSETLYQLCAFGVMPAHYISTYNSKPSYVYQFEHVPTDKPGFPNYGAFHTGDIPFALHTLDRWDRPWQTRDRDMERIMSAYWVNFARTGDPNGPGLPIWKPYDRKEAHVMQLRQAPVCTPKLLQKEIQVLEKLR
jgi:para-nitrobenzyl esterase